MKKMTIYSMYEEIENQGFDYFFVYCVNLESLDDYPHIKIAAEQYIEARERLRNLIGISNDE